MKKKIKTIIQDIWLRAKGNKTIFLSILYSCLEAGLIPLTGGWLLFVKIVVVALGGAALWDHAKSGHFSKKKLK